MERVQFQQEQMLSELKDLAQKGIFTQPEIRQIMKKRTAFETALVRRVPKKGDFLRYAAYETGLEALRKKRVERLKIPKGPASVSDYALVRRQFQIFERALKKFKEDVGLWVQYLQVAKREGARALVGRISARALQLHPNSSALYILAASHELGHLSHSAARILLQRGIRLNPESTDLWREYLKMELGFVESLRRRWEVLGLNVEGPFSSEDQQQNEETSEELGSGSPVGAGDSEKARKDILQGALAKTVITNAVQAKPSSELFSALHGVLISYPCPQSLRTNLLEHLRNLLQSKLSLETDAIATKLCATWYLTEELSGPELVDAIKFANTELTRTVQNARKDRESNSERTRFYADVIEVYTTFVREWFEKDIDDNLRLYLLTSLQSLCVSCKAAPLLLTHLRLLASPLNPKPVPAGKLLRLAKTYTTKATASPDLWLFRLDLEYGEKDENWALSAKEARRSVPAIEQDDSARSAVWEWILDHPSSTTSFTQLKATETILHEASSARNSSTLMDRLLVRYLHALRDHSAHLCSGSEYLEGTQLKEIERIDKLYLPSPNVWESAFDIYSKSPSQLLPPPPATDSTIESVGDSPIAMDIGDDEKELILRMIYNKWRLASPSAHGDAALKWAKWLTFHGKGLEGAEVIASARTAVESVSESLVGEFERRWRTSLDNTEDGGESVEVEH